MSLNCFKLKLIFIDGYYSCIIISIMSSIVRYFGSILSAIERKMKKLMDEESLLPVTSVSDREKCKDLNLDSVSFIRGPRSVTELVTYIIYDDDLV